MTRYELDYLAALDDDWTSPDPYRAGYESFTFQRGGGDVYADHDEVGWTPPGGWGGTVVTLLLGVAAGLVLGRAIR